MLFTMLIIQIKTIQIINLSFNTKSGLFVDKAEAAFLIHNLHLKKIVAGGWAALLANKLADKVD